MDALSQVLQAARARSPLIADLRLGEDVSLSLPSLGGLPFHYVVTGRCRLETGTDRVDLAAGDLVMLARLHHYRLETGGGGRRVEIMDFAERDSFSLDGLRAGRNQLFARTIGDGRAEARVFSAILMPGGGDGNPLIRDLPLVTLLRDVKSLLEPWLISAIDFMAAEVREFEPGLGAIAERLIEVIFLSVLRKWLLDGSHEKGWMRGLTDPAISRVLNAIHAEPGRRWTLSGLATISGRSRSGLARHFREVMDETPFAYVTRWRMHLAGEVVAQGERSLADIAADAGYRGSAAFVRAFRTTYGETPAQHRRRCRDEALLVSTAASPAVGRSGGAGS